MIEELVQIRTSNGEIIPAPGREANRMGPEYITQEAQNPHHMPETPG